VLVQLAERWVWDSEVAGSSPAHSTIVKLVMKVSVVNCDFCGEPFTKRNYEIEKTNHNFCSKSCNAKHQNRIKYGDSVGFAFYVKLANKNSKGKKEVKITPEYLKRLFDSQDGKCAITGVDLILNTATRKMEDKSPYYASLDRIDNSAGYVEGNLHFVALAINYMRNTFSLDEVKSFIETIK
jgi:hypothetical protein